MKKLIFGAAALLFVVSCTTEGRFADGFTYGETAGEYTDIAVSETSGQYGKDTIAAPGVLTAGEWNDLENWTFWKHLLRSQDSVAYYTFPEYWNYSTKGHFPVKVTSGGQAVTGATVVLKQDEQTIWTARTDVFGKAELWAGMTSLQPALDSLNRYVIEVEGVEYPLTPRRDSLHTIELPGKVDFDDRLELAFIVDATGSMYDEIDFLKADLQNVISRVAGQTNSKILVGTVFYRDEDDDYVVRHSDFSSDISRTVKFISEQSAEGGGDYPEAIHTAFESALGDLQWSSRAKTRIAFLVADAPAHYETDIINRLHEQMMRFAAKGIKIIPVASSGVDKNTEFLFRYFAIATNGTYVFLTDHSGVGNSHIEPTVGDYDVEHLDDLLVRLIAKYSLGE